MFPLIPLLALFAILGGGVTLAWYSGLSPKQQQEADRIACGYAKEHLRQDLEGVVEAAGQSRGHAHEATLSRTKAAGARERPPSALRRRPLGWLARKP